MVMLSSSPAPPFSSSVSLSSYHTSLLTAIDSRGHVHLILGTNPLAAARANQSLSVGARPVLIAPAASALHYGVQKHIDAGVLTWLQKDFQDDDILTLGRAEVNHVVDAVFVTAGPRETLSRHVSALCRRHRVPVNVIDAPALCSFSLLSTHSDGPLQIGVTTNGRGCKLASRIRREAAAALPAGLGLACARLGELRKRVQEEDRTLAAAAVATVADPVPATTAPREQGEQRPSHKVCGKQECLPENGTEAGTDEGVDDSVDQPATFNKLVTDAGLDAKTRRMRWLAQVCEYWPLRRLAAISDADIETVLSSYHPDGTQHNTSHDHGCGPANDTCATPRKISGRIILAGSGPGHPDLLTRATYKAIQSADLVLADKLVPAGVLDLIPRRTPVSIARKFPGNADRAQSELLEQALEAVQAGKTVLRLKQGDPFIYGRGGEEVEFFRANGLGDRVIILPGITSSLSAPLFAAIPPTQRDVADQVLICTGTGKRGKPPAPPEFVSSRTVVFLMALHRIEGLVRELTSHVEADGNGDGDRLDGQGEAVAVGRRLGSDLEAGKSRRSLWQLDTPCAVIERASCPDQRVIRTTLRFVAEAIEQEGSRPPGLLVVGRACEALYTPERGRSWTVEDGFKGLELDDLVAAAASSGIAAFGVDG